MILHFGVLVNDFEIHYHFMVFLLLPFTEFYMEEKEAENCLAEEALPKIQTRGFCALKQILLNEGNSPLKILGIEKTEFLKDCFFFAYQGPKSLFPHSPLPDSKSMQEPGIISPEHLLRT